jgi:hypothetical protein
MGTLVMSLTPFVVEGTDDGEACWAAFFPPNEREQDPGRAIPIPEKKTPGRAGRRFAS